MSAPECSGAPGGAAEPYTLGAHARRYAGLTPTGRLRALWRLPVAQQAEAWAALAAEVERARAGVVAP